jgi:hypothetical protein
MRSAYCQGPVAGPNETFGRWLAHIPPPPIPNKCVTGSWAPSGRKNGCGVHCYSPVHDDFA